VNLKAFMLGMEGLSVRIEDVNLTEVHAEGDMVMAERAGRVGQLLSGMGLLFAMQGGLQAIAELVIKAIIQKGEPHSALIMASDVLARSSGRFSSLSVVGVSKDDAGVFTADTIHVGSELSPWPAFVMRSVDGVEDRRRLFELREKREHRPLEDAERAELARLEEDALELVVSVGASHVSIKGLALVATDDGKRSFESELTRIEADRIYLQADTDAADEATGLGAHDLDRSGTASPLELLRASGDASAEARLLQFHAIISGLQTTPTETAQIGPTMLLEGLEFQSAAGGLALKAQGVSAGSMALSILADRFVPDAPDEMAPPTMEPRAGDRLTVAESLKIAHLMLSIERTDDLLAAWSSKEKPPPSEQDAEAQTQMLMKFLHDLSGTATFSLHVKAPDLGRLGKMAGVPAWPQVQLVQVELQKGGKLKWRLLGARLPQFALQFVDSIDELYAHYQTILQTTAKLGQMAGASSEPTPSGHDRASAAQQDELYKSLPAFKRGLEVEGLRKWLETESKASFAYVEVVGSNVRWEPTHYEFDPDSAVTRRGDLTAG